jgi:hypothetical protein
MKSKMTGSVPLLLATSTACAFGCRDLGGGFGFSAGQAYVVPCTDAGGLDRVLVFAGTRDRGADCLVGPPDSATAVVDADCDSLSVFQDPSQCDPSFEVAPYLRKQVSSWLLADGESLAGAGGSSATWTHCTGREDPTDSGPIAGELVVLDGTVMLTDVEGTTATVDFRLDGLSGAIDAEVCE